MSESGSRSASGGERLLVALAAAGAAAALGYAAARALEIGLFPASNPATLIGAAQSPFAWRCWNALYLGGLGGIGGWALGGRSPGAAARWVARGAAGAALAMALQGALLP